MKRLPYDNVTTFASSGLFLIIVSVCNFFFTEGSTYQRMDSAPPIHQLYAFFLQHLLQSYTPFLRLLFFLLTFIHQFHIIAIPITLYHYQR